MSTAEAIALKEYLLNHADEIGKVVDFDPATDRLMSFDFTANNTFLSPETIADTGLFSNWIEQQLGQSDSRYGIGGYNEHRTLYARSSHFGDNTEPRRLHLGVDIWGPAGTAIYSPLNGYVHSFQFNDHFGDYGATIILVHQLGNLTIHTLYGHLSLASLDGLEKGHRVPKGSHFADFGIPEENGHWPPHLHFQLIFDMGSHDGDYPGVCAFPKREEYLRNCPDPNDLLAFTF
ncbi:MAG TPA: peptidoglycan DD-metalloendopeptidase family protein [Daejeonella sp.]|nr:peptidoglycan DD-metalloendopeptidase family protein [Daejeonella sp.]